MEDPKIYTMSETYEDHTVDDYLKQGDIGPFFAVVPLHYYQDLKEKLEVAREALEFYKIPYQKHDFVDRDMNGEEYVRNSLDEDMGCFAEQALKEIGEE
jgi:hypothetical protein